MEENKEKALNLLAEYHEIFALEMGCTEAAKQKIKMTDLKPFKERPRNIPSGLIEEVKEHLDHMFEESNGESYHGLPACQPALGLCKK